MPVTFTKIPKEMSDISKYSNIYTLELCKFGIHNDGTHPDETSRGINQALQYAKTIGANRIVFPPGTYLIKETDPIIFNHQNTVVDLNGATLKMNPNGMQKNTMVMIGDGTKNFRLTNGILLGDRATHDYSHGGTSEHCSALTLESGYNMEIDHLTVREFPGFAIQSMNGVGNSNQNRRVQNVYTSNVELGEFSASGDKIGSTSKLRTIEPVDLSRFIDYEFEFGHTYGYQGLDLVFEREYNAYFYDANMNFIEKKSLIQYRKSSFSPNARFIHFEFDQTTIPEGGRMGRLSDFAPPEHVHFHNNWIYQNRGLGQAFTGGQKWIIENNLYEENGFEADGVTKGAAPAMALDFEDGWELMQDIVFRNNTFRNNRSDMVVVAGTEMIFEGNTFEKLAFFYRRAGNYVFRQNSMIGEPDFSLQNHSYVYFNTRVGVKNKSGTSIHHNYYENIRWISIQEKKPSPDSPVIKLEHETMKNFNPVGGGLKGKHIEVHNSGFESIPIQTAEDEQHIKLVKNEFIGDDNYIYFNKDGTADILVENINPIGILYDKGSYIQRKVERDFIVEFSDTY